MIPPALGGSGVGRRCYDRRSVGCLSGRSARRTGGRVARLLLIARAIPAGGASDGDWKRCGAVQVQRGDVDLGQARVKPDGFVGNRQGQAHGEAKVDVAKGAAGSDELQLGGLNPKGRAGRHS